MTVYKPMLSLLILAFTPLAYSLPQNLSTQTIEINTALRSFIGKPTWLVIIRDMDSQNIYPYIFDFSRNEHAWMVFTLSDNYQVAASQLILNPYNVTFNNFCGIEGRIYKRKSMRIRLKGDLTSRKNSFDCSVTTYQF